MLNKFVFIRSYSGQRVTLRLLLAALLGTLFSSGQSFAATLAEALNPNLTWSTSGNAAWYAQVNFTRDGTPAAQSGLIGANQQSVLETTVTGPGALNFWWRVSSETNNDALKVAVGGVEQFRISGNVNWQNRTLYVGAGPQTVSWTYSKNESGNFGADAGWLDQVSFSEGETAAFVAVQPAHITTTAFANVTLAPVTGGTPPIAYQWHLNGTPLPNATNASLVLSNVQVSDAGVYSLTVTNAFGGEVSSNANVTVLDLFAFGAGRSNNISPHLGQSLISTNAAGITAVTAGVYHNLALRTNGTVIGWGLNTSGQSTVPGGTTGRAIAAGMTHSLVLRSNGTVVGWGNSLYGPFPPLSATNVSAIAAGWYHSLALRSNGTVIAWGNSSPSYRQSNVPTNLPAIKALAAGAYHSMALTTNGTVIAWGLNASGQTNVPVGLSNVVAIAAGASNCIALKADGTLVAWGDNTYGQTNIPPDLTNVCAITAGAGHQIALKTDGSLVGWGLNNFGQIDFPSGLTNLSGITCGGYHTLALFNQGPITFVSQPFSQTVFKGSLTGFEPAVSGAGPISYQWQFNSSDLWGQTNRWLIFTNAQLNDTGLYRLIASNSFGAVTSAVARVTVNDTAPFFPSQPQNVNVATNTTAVITANVGGVPPFNYQWRFDGTNLPGQTKAFLSITNAQMTNEGFYSVAVTNSFGFAISSNAFLNVIDLAEALNATNFTWVVTGVPTWFPQTDQTHDGIAAAAFDSSFGFGVPTLRTTMTGPGTLKYWWRSTSSTVRLVIDGLIPGYFFGYSESWQQQTVYLGEGTHTVEWANHGSTGLPSWFFLDEVTYEPGPTPVFFLSKPSDRTIGAGTDVSINASMGGTPPLTNQWQFNGAVMPGITGSSLSLPNVQPEDSGTYTLIVSNAYGFTNISVVLTVTNTSPSIRTQPVGMEMVRNGNAYFSVVARGSDPLSYQWRFNQMPIDGATNSSLLLTQLQPEHAGNYSVIVTNAFGVVTSANAALSVVPTVIVGWGSVFTSSPNPPQGLTNVSAISAGDDFSIALKTDGTVHVWGWNAFSKLNVPAGLSNVVAVSAGGMHGSALLNNGTLVNWGDVFFDPSVKIPTGLSNVVQTAAGHEFHIALRNDQTVFVWGDNFIGPLDIPPSLTNGAVTIAAGKYHGLVVRRNGTVGAWGYNSFGQAIVPEGLSNVVAISAGGSHSLALLKNGTMRCWGISSLTNLPPAATNIVNIDSGDDHALALRNDGTVLAWGSSSTATGVPFWLTNVVAVSAGSSHSLALLNDGSPYIVRQPLNLVEWSGADVELNISALGHPSLTYQWQFNGTNLSGATNPSLLLTNISVTQAGFYRCIVSNALGTASSRPAELTVLRTTPMFDPKEIRWNENGRFQLFLSGASGHGSVILYASTNLLDWDPIFTNPPFVGELLFEDASATNFPKRFYKFEEQ